MDNKKKKIIQKSGKHYSETERHSIIREMLKNKWTKQFAWELYTGEPEERGQLMRWMRKLGYVKEIKHFVLPYLDQVRLYKQFNFQTQRAEPLNLFQTRFAVYRCPEDPSPDNNSQRGEFGTMNYSGNFGPVAPPRWMANGLTEFWPGQAPTLTETNGLAFLNSRVAVRDILDGTSNTILVGERSATGGAAIWMGVRGNEFETDQVTDCSPGHEINFGEAGFSSRHGGGANFLFCDGTVRFLSEQIESGPGEQQQMKTYQKLSHRSDGFAIGGF